jgi:hypothetical protein
VMGLLRLTALCSPSLRLRGGQALLSLPLMAYAVDLRTDQGCERLLGVAIRPREEGGECDHLSRKDGDRIRTSLGPTYQDQSTRCVIEPVECGVVL